MKCTKCGYENNESFTFCPICGNEAKQPQSTNSSAAPSTVTVNSVADRALTMLKNNLYLTICILISVSAGTAVLNEGVPLLSILMTIFLWIIFAKSRKGIADYKNMRCVSGTIFATYVIMIVTFSFIAVTGVILSLAIGALSESGLLADILSDANIGYSTQLIENISSLSAAILIPLFITISAAGILVTVFGIRPIHRFAQSLYQSIAINRFNIIKRNAAQTWLMVFGVIGAISAVSSLFSGEYLSFISAGCSASSMIIGRVLINRYFADCN